MYMLKLFIVYAFIYISRGSFEEKCLESYGTWFNHSIIRGEYTYLLIPYIRIVKRRCRSGPLTIVWMKDDVEIKRHKIKKEKMVVTELKFHLLSKADRGNYTLFFSNDKFNFTHITELIVSRGSFHLKTIREHTIPSNSSDIARGKLYWTPKMAEIKRTITIQSYDSYSLHCYFFSTKGVNDNIVTWYFSRSLTQSYNAEDRLPINSRVHTSFFEYNCIIDDWMPEIQGHCYEAALNFTPFFGTDSGTYTCNINNSLINSFVLLDKVNNIRQIIPNRNYNYINNDNLTDLTQENTLTNTNNVTVCVGSTFILKCSAKSMTYNVSIWFVNVTGYLQLLTRSDSWEIHHNLTNIGWSDAGKYICKEGVSAERHILLFVHRCVSLTFYGVLVGLCMAITLMVMIAIAVYCRYATVFRRFYLHNNIHSFTKLKSESMYRNERYIPLIQDFDMEIPREHFTMSLQLLGVGGFSKVFKGRLRDVDVAVKIANADGNDMLVQEIKIMTQLGYHRHVIQLLGVCSKSEPLMAILELADGGNLRQHLRDHNPLLKPCCEQIGLEQLLCYVTQIASGMLYLASKQVIHRDLAARNCLLTSDMSVKLSDFGLTRLACNYYHNESQEVKPVAWMAPEAISHNLFTSKSDVWSFGIVMWEVFQLGACPYPSMSHGEILEAVCRGTAVNSQPVLASEAIYDIMTRCWSHEANDRPSFGELTAYLDEVDVNEYM